MKEHAGFWLPDDDAHFTNYSQLADYQEPIREAAMPLVRGLELAVDLGAHVGIFSRWFATRFEQVLAIEADAENHRCLLRNVGENVITLRGAVGQLPGWGRVERGGRHNTGDNRISRSGAPAAEGDERFVRIHTLDKLLAKRLPGVPVRLIKLDLQGGELPALHGAADTLARWSPVLIVEMTSDTPPPHRPETFLTRAGYEHRQTIRHDQVWSKA